MIPRIVMAAAAVAMFALAAPPLLSVLGLVALAGLVTTSYAVRHPGTLAASGVLALAVLCWLVAVDDPGVVRAAAFGAAGFVVHSSAALAAGMTPRAPTERLALWAWAGRGGLAVVIGVGLVALSAAAGGQPNSALLVVLGLVAAALLMGLLLVPARWITAGRPGRPGGRSLGA